MFCQVVLERLQLYHCDECSKKFYDSRDWREHRIIHIKDAEYDNKKSSTENKRRMKWFKSKNCYGTFKEQVNSQHNCFKNICASSKNVCTGNHGESGDKSKVKLYTTKKQEKQKIEVSITPIHKTESKHRKGRLGLQRLQPKAKNNLKSIKYQISANDINDDIGKTKTTDNDGPFTCGQCSNSYKTLAAMTLHLGSHCGPSYPCPQCSKSFPNVTQLNRHMTNMHIAKYKLSCSMCDKKFKNNSNLKIHFRTHTGERPFPCKECGKRFTQTASLYTHTKIHLGIKEHICSYCDRAFSEYHNMKTHERTHTNERPFECQYCGKAFSDQSALKRHIRTHTGDKIYQCQLCPMKFSDASGRIAHRRRHSGIKNFACSYCAKKFFTHHDVQKHESSLHMLIKNFECHDCHKKFSLKQYLRIHIIRNHIVKRTLQKY